MSDATTPAIEGLYQSLLELGQAHTNPVLAILPDPDNIKQGVKYPDGQLRFANTRLRAYYHSHTSPWLRKLEHGHFHLFIKDRPDQADWSHLAALSVDRMGQPRSWFCVNNWVTGGTWLDTGCAANILDALSRQDTGAFSAVEKWLFYMLQVYRQRLIELLIQRDLKLSELASTDNFNRILNDHSIYDLAEIPVDLINDLTIMTEAAIKTSDHPESPTRA